MSINKILNEIVSEGIKSILKPFGRYPQVTHLIDSIQESFLEDLYSDAYDFIGYIKNLTRLESLYVPKNKIKRRILSKFNASLKMESVEQIIKEIKIRLDSDIYFIILNTLGENLARNMFYQVFGTPELDIQQKAVIDLIWNAFDEEVLKISNPTNLLLRLDHQETNPDDIKQIINYVIEKDANLQISEEQCYDYKNVWEKLVDLKVAGEKLWNKANEENLEAFDNTFREVKHSINKCEIFYKSKYNKELDDLFETFQRYSSGKEHLMGKKKKKL